MSDRKIIIERLRKLIDKSKEGIRVRLTDRAFARIATATVVLLLASTAHAGPMRQVSPPVRPTYCAPKVIYVVVPVRPQRPVVIYSPGWAPYR